MVTAEEAAANVPPNSEPTSDNVDCLSCGVLVHLWRSALQQHTIGVALYLMDRWASGFTFSNQRVKKFYLVWCALDCNAQGVCNGHSRIGGCTIVAAEAAADAHAHIFKPTSDKVLSRFTFSNQRVRKFISCGARSTPTYKASVRG